MLTESGRVVALEPGAVWVEISRELTCNREILANVSGHVVVDCIGNGSQSYLKLSTAAFPPGLFKVNDQVSIAIPKRYFLDTPLLVYGAPLLTTLACLALAVGFFPNTSDETLALGAALGYTGGFLLVRLHTRWLCNGSDFRPRLIGPERHSRR